MQVCVSMPRVRGCHLYVENSTFVRNDVALKGGGDVIIRNSLFANNTCAVSFYESFSLHIENSAFLHHYQVALYISEVNSATIVNSFFADNREATTSPDVGYSEMKGCVFLRNGLGPTMHRVFDSLFLDNKVGAKDASLHNCLFYNNRLAVRHDKRMFHIQNVTFLENDVGIETKDASIFQQVNFIGTKDFNLKYTGTAPSKTKDDVYWGTSNETEIRSKIYDAYQGSRRGIVRIGNFEDNPRYHDVFPQGFDPAIHLATYYNETFLHELLHGRLSAIPYVTSATDQNAGSIANSQNSTTQLGPSSLANTTSSKDGLSTNAGGEHGAKTIADGKERPSSLANTTSSKDGLSTNAGGEDGAKTSADADSEDDPSSLANPTASKDGLSTNAGGEDGAKTIADSEDCSGKLSSPS